MYHSIKTETNGTFASMQRTFYPKHCSYFGDGTGRDLQVTIDNGGLNRPQVKGMGHTGVQFSKFKSNVHRRSSPSPCKDASTFYYQSDGSGRDTYVLQNNGGLRPEFKISQLGDRIFKSSLRSQQKSPLKHFVDPAKDRADITSYLNWQTQNGRAQQVRKARITKDLINRLSSGSPSRETTINYVLGTGRIGHEKRLSQPSFQGCKRTYDKEFVRVQQKQFTQSNKIMKHVYKGPNDNLTANEKHDFSNNLIRQIDNTNNTETPRVIQMKNKSAIRGGGERPEPESRVVDVVQLKEAMNRIRMKQAQSVMKRQPAPYTSMQLKGQREEVAKTSWKKKRGTIQFDAHKFGSTTMGNGMETHDTTGGAQTIDALGTGSEGIYSSFVQHNRNLSVNQGSLHESVGNIQSNMRKLEPLSESKRGSDDPQAIKMVSKLLNNDKQSIKSRQNFRSVVNPSPQNTFENKRARKLDHHLDGMTAAEIYSNANNKGFSRQNMQNSVFNSIASEQKTAPSPPKENTEEE